MKETSHALQFSLQFPLVELQGSKGAVLRDVDPQKHAVDHHSTPWLYAPFHTIAFGVTYTISPILNTSFKRRNPPFLKRALQ